MGTKGIERPKKIEATPALSAKNQKMAVKTGEKGIKMQ
jgi:hypothetical protein